MSTNCSERRSISLGLKNIMIYVITFLIMTGTSLALRLKDIDVPPHRVVGEKARLICKFDMEGDILYSVKWYKDDLEFYRFVPNDRPKLQVFPQEGIHVDKKKSTKQHVQLFNLTAASGGTYKCEVSAEAPSFRTKSGSQDMVVVVLPKKSEIKGADPKYQVGDYVNVSCYSYRSRPAASLTWRINDHEVNPYQDIQDRSYAFIEDRSQYGTRKHKNTRRNQRNRRHKVDAKLREYPPIQEPGNLETSRLGLQFRVRPEHVEQGIKLECTAAIGAVYWQSFQEKIPVVPRLKESTASRPWWGGTSGASSSSFVQHANILLVRLLVLSSFLPIVILALTTISINGLT